MDQEELVRQIMAEVMKSLGAETSATTRTTTPVAASQGKRVGREHYPLAEKHPEMISTSTGRPLSDLTFSAVMSGELKPEDFRISSGTLELQAQVAEDAGRPTLARNLRRAAELVAVPDERLLAIYNSLRPYRSTKAELYEIADELEGTYGAKISAGFIREAADVYESRGRLRQD